MINWKITKESRTTPDSTFFHSTEQAPLAPLPSTTRLLLLLRKWGSSLKALHQFLSWITWKISICFTFKSGAKIWTLVNSLNHFLRFVFSHWNFDKQTNFDYFSSPLLLIEYWKCFGGGNISSKALPFLNVFSNVPTNARTPHPPPIKLFPCFVSLSFHFSFSLLFFLAFFRLN